QRFSEDYLLLCRCKRIVNGGRTKIHHQLFCQGIDRVNSIFFARCDNLHQRRPAECRHTEEAAAKRGTRLAFQGCRITIPERKSTRYRPFSRLSRLFKHEGIRSIEPYCAKELHARGPFALASNQIG